MQPFKPTSGLTTCGVKRLRDATQPILVPEQGESGVTRQGIRASVAETTAAPLSTDQRKNLDSSQFVFPDKAPGSGSCPINDREHAEKALQLCTPKDVVKRKVCAKFPSLPACGD